MLLNLESRLAQRVLIEVAEGAYRDEDDLYALARGVDWARLDHAAADAAGRHAPRSAARCKSLNFAALRIKDAVCDQLREATGERPSVDTRAPDLHARAARRRRARHALCRQLGRVAVQARLARATQGDAPLKETLAAAMLAAAGWRGTPERRAARCTTRAAARARSRSRRRRSPAASRPGLLRRFAFERLLPFASAEHARRDAAPAQPRRRRACTRQRGADLRQRRVVPHGRLRAPQRRARRRRRRRSSSTAATRWSARRRRCRPNCRAR